MDDASSLRDEGDLRQSAAPLGPPERSGVEVRHAVEPRTSSSSGGIAPLRCAWR